MILKRDEFFEKIHARIGTDTSEDAIAFVEDMTDTYNDLERRLAGDGEDWKRKYDELDAAWKEKYKHRFFSGDNSAIPTDSMDQQDDQSRKDETITIDELFK